MASYLFDLSGKTALITGASRGLGQNIAIALANAGAEVICSSSKAGGTDETLSMIRSKGGIAKACAANLSEQSGLDSLVEACAKVDILVNNGGTIARYPATDYPLDEWQKVININLDAAFYLSQQFGKRMIAAGAGKIINIASMLSYSGGIAVPAYTASKHAIAGVTKALANEWACHNVQVNAIAPGYFETDNTQAIRDDQDRNAQITQRIPANRWGQPEELAGAAVFLASSASNYVNGHILAVDGGWLAR